MLYLITMFRSSMQSPCRAAYLAHSSGVWPAGQGNACVQDLCVWCVCVRVERAERAVGVAVWACMAPMGMVDAGYILSASLGAILGSRRPHVCWGWDSAPPGGTEDGRTEAQNQERREAPRPGTTSGPTKATANPAAAPTDRQNSNGRHQKTVDFIKLKSPNRLVAFWASRGLNTCAPTRATFGQGI